MKKAFIGFILANLIYFTWSCANMGYPSGGPKDEEMPTISQSDPVPNALNFTGREIAIEFNELIQLKEVHQKLVVSPPLNERPNIEARGNELRIEFEEDLQPNTTYTLDFADAISDNNEGNVIPAFRFSFSTGEVVDSMQISGHLFEAIDLAPADGILVMVHDNLSDTAFQTRVPVRMAKTDSEGYFSIQNIRPGRYRIYALGDTNNNYQFDQPGERIAWYDAILEPSFEYRQVIDSIVINTDSLSIDSVVVSEKLFYTPDSLQLFLFQEDFKQQFLDSDNRPEKGKLSFIFNRPLQEDFKIEITGHEERGDWAIFENTLSNDTVHVWLADSTMYNQDSLSFTLTYQVLDSLQNLVDRKDTLTMYHFEVKQEKKKRKKKDEKVEIPHIKFPKAPGSINIYSACSFTLPAPAISFDEEAIHLYQQVDTIMEPVAFDFWQDSLNVRKYYILANWEPGGSYQYTIDSAAIEDLYHLKNFPVNNSFKIKKEEDYGEIYIHIDQPENNWLVQVLDSKESIVQQAYLPENGKLAFVYLRPGSYMLRVIEDKNRNEQWDTGNYESIVQPEQLMYYPAKVELRANWEQKVTDWDPRNFNIYEFSKNFRKPSSTSRNQ
jgi:uncharacterized protein (DUF2141 family)